MEEERFDLDTSLAIFCHQPMTKEYCFIFTSFKVYENESLNALIIGP